MNEKKPMKFLLLPREGKPRFSSKDPWEYIKSKGLKMIEDYDRTKEYLSKEAKERLGQIYFNGVAGEIPIYIVFLSKDGKRCTTGELNNNASAFCRAYCHINDVYEEAIIVRKIPGTQDLIPFTSKEIKIARGMLADAIRWFS